MSTLAHESTCEKLRGMPFCTCPVPPQPSSPQQTMTTLQRIESGIGALRGDLDKLMQSHAALEKQLSELAVRLASAKEPEAGTVGNGTRRKKSRTKSPK